MAREMGGRSVPVRGNLAYDVDIPQREMRMPPQRRTTPARRPAAAPVQRGRKKTAVRRREREHVSPLTLLGFAAAAALLTALLTSYAYLTTISDDVVKQQQELSDLREEYVMLLTLYEQTFDLSSVKEAAEASGMSRPSPSQVYYVDLSAPDSVVIYQPPEGNILQRVVKTARRCAGAMVEYFR